MKTWQAAAWAMVVVLTALTVAHGDRYWDTGAGEDRNWTTADNWSGNTLPTAADAVYIGHASYTRSATATLSRTVGCNWLYLGASANTTGTLYMTSGYVTNGGSLVVGSVAGCRGTSC